MTRWITKSERETENVGKRLVPELEPDGTLLLTGDLGSGKTVLTRGVARGLGLDPRVVQSPTFTLMREHRVGDRSLIHIDLYRLDSAEAEALGLEEVLAGEGVKVVEWAERLEFPVPAARRLHMRRGLEETIRIIEDLGIVEQSETRGEA